MESKTFPSISFLLALTANSSKLKRKLSQRTCLEGGKENEHLLGGGGWVGVKRRSFSHAYCLHSDGGGDVLGGCLNPACRHEDRL